MTNLQKGRLGLMTTMCTLFAMSACADPPTAAVESVMAETATLPSFASLTIQRPTIRASGMNGIGTKDVSLDVNVPAYPLPVNPDGTVNLNAPAQIISLTSDFYARKWDPLPDAPGLEPGSTVTMYIDATYVGNWVKTDMNFAVQGFEGSALGANGGFVQAGYRHFWNTFTGMNAVSDRIADQIDISNRSCDYTATGQAKFATVWKLGTLIWGSEEFGMIERGRNPTRSWPCQGAGAGGGVSGGGGGEFITITTCYGYHVHENGVYLYSVITGCTTNTYPAPAN